MRAIRAGAETLLRPLDWAEALFAYHHALMQGNTQVMTHVLVEGEVAPEDLLRAAHALFCRYQILRTNLREHDEQLWFAEHGDFSRIRIQVTKVASPQEAEKYLQEELAEPVDSVQALWRLRLVAISSNECSIIILVRNHAISDGFSTALFFRELLALLTEGREERSPATLSESLAGWPSPLMGARQSIDTEAGVAPELNFRALLPVPQRTPRFLDLDITHQESTKLLVFCKRNGITVTQLLSALFLKSFCRVTGVRSMNLFTAVSLRSGRFHAEPVREMGCHIAVARTAPTGVDGDTVVLANECGQLLEKAVNAWQPQPASHPVLRRQVEELARSDCFGGIAITNVGSVAGSDFTGGIRPLGMRTVVNRIGANYAVVLHVLSFDGNLCATFAYSEPAMSASDIGMMRAAFRVLMEECR